MSVLVFIEHRGGKLKKHAYQCISYAVELSRQYQLTSVGLVVGNIEQSEFQKIANLGVQKIVHVDHPALQYLDNQLYTSIVEKVGQKEQSKFYVFQNSLIGKAIAPRVAVRMNVALLAGIVALPVSYEPLTVKKRTYNGEAFLRIILKSHGAVLTLNPNACDVIERAVTLDVETFQPDVDYTNVSTKVVDVQMITDKVILTEAPIVVSGGRGLKSPDNWKILEDLAEVLGAALACSRPVSDEGWRPHEEHVGQTGKIIAPDLYIAVGISGAIQHMGGVSGSRVILAINKDKDAPIFSYADYGVVGDAFTVVPKLTEAFRKFKS